MEVYFIRYRKLLLAGSIFMFFYFFFEIYTGIEIIRSNQTGRGIGTFVDAGITLFVSIYLFINVRKANKQFKEETAAREFNNNGNDLL
jgi:hypothetical protein